MVRSFFYYVGHTIVNTIKKLFRTWLKWIVLFMLCCILVGVIAGAIAAVFIPDDAFEPDETEEEAIAEEAEEEVDPDLTMNVTELVAGALAFVYLGVAISVSSRSIDNMIQMADVNTLFPSPHKPQSVLMFRTAMQVGLPLIMCFYLGGQIPNLVLNAHLGAFEIISLFVALFLLALFARILAVFLYVLSSKFRFVRKIDDSLPLVALALAGAGFVAYLKFGCDGVFSWEAVTSYVNSDISRMIPVWGWLKSLASFAYEGNILAWVGSVVGTLLLGLGLLFVTFNLRVDFYEDAIVGAEKRQEQLEKAAANKNRISFGTKKRKETADVKELGLQGSGASTFFSKTMRVRKRNAKLGFATGTMIFVFILCAGIAVFTRFVAGSQTYLPITITLAIGMAMCFLGNPISDDSSMHVFFMAPVKPNKLIWACMSAKLICVTLDILPGLLIAEAILLANPLWMLGTLLSLTSLYFCAAAWGFFADMLVPTSLHQAVRAIVQMWLFVLFIAPLFAGIMLLITFGFMLPGLFILTAYCCVVATIVMLVSPGLYANGRK